MHILQIFISNYFFYSSLSAYDESEDEIESDKEESDDEGIEDSSNPSSDLSN